jgi:aminoglycoside phosphotransferase (APT) family kinase protein
LLSDELLRVLRRDLGVTDLSYRDEPARLSGGFWAELLVFRLAAAPNGWDRPLVARLMPDARIASKEAIVQAEVAVQGYPTPTVRLVESPEGGIDGRALMIMDLAAGEPAVAGLGGGAAVATLPSMVRRLPNLLAQVLARLHALDPAPVLARLDASGLALPDLAAMLDGFRTSAIQLNHDTLLAAGEWLAAHRPDGSDDVICHGDMHPFNVLVDDDDKPTVLDWSAAVIAPRGYDLAFTSLMLAEPPLVAPRAVRPLLRVFGAILSRRFLRAYHRLTGAPPDHSSLAWFQGVMCVRALTEVAWWTATDSLDDHAGHPWVINEIALIKRLRRTTGISVPHSRAQDGGGFHTSGPPR